MDRLGQHSSRRSRKAVLPSEERRATNYNRQIVTFGDPIWSFLLGMRKSNPIGHLTVLTRSRDVLARAEYTPGLLDMRYKREFVTVTMVHAPTSKRYVVRVLNYNENGEGLDKADLAEASRLAIAGGVWTDVFRPEWTEHSGSTPKGTIVRTPAGHSIGAKSYAVLEVED